jgi:ribokinase
MLESFGNDGIDLTHVTVDADVPSGTALVMIGADGDNYLSVAPGSNALLKPHDVTAATEVISQSAVLLTQMEVPAESVNQALAIASSAGVHCVLNYAPATGQTIQVDRRINTLIVNETEARQLAGREGDDRALAQALHERGPEVVVLTLGSAGVLVLDGDGCRTMPALKVVPVDATAAGDTFCGAYATAIAEGNTVDDAVAFGQTAAALCVTKLGAQPSIPTRDDIEQRLRAGP